VCSGGVAFAGSPFKGAGPPHPAAVSGLVFSLPTDTEGEGERRERERNIECEEAEAWPLGSEAPT